MAAACASSSTTVFFSMRSASGNARASASRWLRNTSAAAGAATERSPSSARAARLERIPQPHRELVGDLARAHRLEVPVLELQHHVRVGIEVHPALVDPERLIAVGVEAAGHVVLRVGVLDPDETLPVVS